MTVLTEILLDAFLMLGIVLYVMDLVGWCDDSDDDGDGYGT